MLARRDLLGAGFFANLAGSSRFADTPEQISDRSATEVVNALKDVGSAIDQPWSFAELRPLRQRMTEFLHAQMKFPDFIDVGSDIWIMVYDWHVKHFQPLSLARDASGRYLLLFMQTTLVLHADAVPNYIGSPYDKT